MRYLKVLFLACLLFLALVFFFQNQAVFATKMELKLDLFFIPPMTSISLPFYFLIFCSFFIGVVLALILLVWDRLNLSARIMKDKWQIQNLSSKLAKAEKLMQNQNLTFWGRLANFFSVQQPAKPLTPEAKQQINQATNAVSNLSNANDQAPKEAASKVEANQPA
ncbi:MAG: LapA family protein [Desulfovibrionaceae bacterium]|nr:LapA family protein [Desulfovibrionaceae bacterium]